MELDSLTTVTNASPTDALVQGIVDGSIIPESVWLSVDSLSELLSETNDLQEALHKALVFVLEKVKRAGGVLTVRTLEETNSHMIISQGVPAQWSEWMSDKDSPLRQICREVIETGEHSWPDATIDMDLACSLPLLTKSGVQGALLVYGKPCSQGELLLLMYLARVIGRTIQMVRSHAKAASPNGVPSTNQLIYHTLDANLDPEEMLAKMIVGVCQNLDGEGGSIVMVDEERADLLIRKTYSGKGNWIYLLSQRSDEPWVNSCLDSGEPLVENQLEEKPKIKAVLGTELGMQIKSVLCIPLIAKGQKLGVIEILNKRSGSFTIQDQELLESLASLIAYLVYNTRLVHRLRVASADLEASRWELLRSRNTLRALFDNIPQSIYIIDHKYNLVAINKDRAHRVGLEPKDLVNRRCYEVLYQRDAPCPNCKVSETFFNAANTNRLERRWENPEEPVEWEITTYPIFDDAGRTVQTIVLEKDVTEKVRMEAVIAQSEKMAAVGQLAAGVAHEINNPLTAVMGNAQILRRDLAGDEDALEAVDLIIRASSRAAQVVRNLLDFARKEQYELNPTDINETIERAIELLQHEFLSRSITLTYLPSRDLPLTMASEHHLQGVWLNLLINGFDVLTDSGGGEMRITTKQQGNEIRVIVSDNGDGIPPEAIKRIFEPFYTTKAPGHGTGLGLSVCHRIVKQHGGHIMVDSKIGNGTEFTVVMPIIAPNRS